MEMEPMRAIRLLPRLVMGLVLASAAACTDSTGPGAAISGTFTLSTVGGQGLPVTLQQSGTTRTELTAGSFTFNADHTFSNTLTTRTTTGGTPASQTTTDGGTYATSGDRVTLNYSDGTFDTGILGTSTFTLSASGLALVFTR
jgi:hypothetical protein